MLPLTWWSSSSSRCMLANELLDESWFPSQWLLVELLFKLFIIFSIHSCTVVINFLLQMSDGLFTRPFFSVYSYDDSWPPLLPSYLSVYIVDDDRSDGYLFPLSISLSLIYIFYPFVGSVYCCQSVSLCMFIARQLARFIYSPYLWSHQWTINFCSFHIN